MVPDGCTYVFGFARAGTARSLAPLPGLDGADVDGLGQGPIEALCCQVHGDDFTGPGADRRLGDLQWLGPRACRHEEVLALAMSRSPVLPCRFGTLFASTARVGQALRRHQAAIGAFLDGVEGRGEWSLKGRVDAARAVEALVLAEGGGASATPTSAPAASGTAYLRSRSSRQRAEAGLRDWVARVADELASQLAAVADRVELQTPAAGADADFQLALLVPRGGEEQMRNEAARAEARLRAHGVRMELTGPWPPYSFSPSLETGVP